MKSQEKYHSRCYEYDLDISWVKLSNLNATELLLFSPSGSEAVSKLNFRKFVAVFLECI